MKTKTPLWIGSAVSALGALPAGAADHDIAVTIYSKDTALIQDHRSINVTGGRQRLEFQNVSARIRPETVALAAEGITIVEQNFDFDLLTPAKMMEKAVGQEVTLVRTSPGTGTETREKALVLATNEGVVLKIGERIEILRDDGLPVRVIFDKLPENLRARPTLSVTVYSPKGGTRPATLSYLTPGLGWKADYVALYNETDSKLDVQGWVTLTNSSGTTYDDAKTMLVAASPGEPAAETNNWTPRRPQRSELVQPGTESGSRERVCDFYLYPIAERTTIANLQTIQVSFLDVHCVPAEHAYEFRNPWLGTAEKPRSAQSVYRFTTSAKAGLGDQLPAGTLRFYMHDKRGEPQYISKSHIDHTPKGSLLALSTGDAFDVKVQPTVLKRTALGDFNWRTEMRYSLTNALPKPVTVSLLQDGLWGDSTITAESQKSKRRSSDLAEWTVQIPANGKAEVTATITTRF